MCNFPPQSLSLPQIEELHDDIERYLSLEQGDINIDFWTVSSSRNVSANLVVHRRTRT
jgi:hypothetical protein